MIRSLLREREAEILRQRVQLEGSCGILKE